MDKFTLITGIALIAVGLFTTTVLVLTAKPVGDNPWYADKKITGGPWYVVVERYAYIEGSNRIERQLAPYAVGPFEFYEAAEVERDSDGATVTYGLLTIDAKNEGYSATDCYIVPAAGLPESAVVYMPVQEVTEGRIKPAALARQEAREERYAEFQEGDAVILWARVARANSEQAFIEFRSMEGPFSVRVPLSELRRVGVHT